jgi:hypothetical protein
VTEDEAKTKWCPFARTVETDGRGSTNGRNRVASTGVAEKVLAAELLGAQCIASACMAWRWSLDSDFNGPPNLHKDEAEVDRRFAAITDPNKSSFRKGGYCGLAGQPS